MKTNFLKLYHTTKVISGSKRLLLIDVQHNNLFLAPNSLTYILEKSKSETIYQILESFETNEEKNIIKEYIDWLIDNDLGFICKSKEEFIAFSLMNNDFDIPFVISNMIIDISSYVIDNFSKINHFLINYGIPYIELRFYQKINENQIICLLNLLNETFVEQINIYIPSNSLKTVFIENIILEYPRIKFFTVYNSKKEKSIDLLKGQSTLIYKKTKIDSKLHCGNITKDFFVINQLLYAESLNHNSCLHKKISIDKDGYIRNCPSMPQHFGNIKDNTLEEALNHPDFKKYWNVTKDMIAVCKDCEFRHICTDCRAYTERTHFEEDIDLSKPLKCGYNPYTNEWAEWSTNPLKEKAIEYYGMQDLVKKVD